MDKEFVDVKFKDSFNLVPADYKDVILQEQLFSARTLKRLQLRNLVTLEDLLNVSPAELKKIAGFGKGCLVEINSFLNAIADGIDDKPLIRGRKKFSYVFRCNLHEICEKNYAFFDAEANSGEAREFNEIVAARESLDDALFCNGNIDVLQLQNLMEISELIYKALSKQQEISSLLERIPLKRRLQDAVPYIKAYSSDESIQNKLLDYFANCENIACVLKDKILSDVDAFPLIRKFLAWCDYDLSQEISDLFNDLFNINSRYSIVIKRRSEGCTLEDVGQELGITRERIRQIEKKAIKDFTRLQSRVQILYKIAAERNGDSLIPADAVLDYCDNLGPQLLYLLKGCTDPEISFDKVLDLFIIGDNTVSGRIFECIETLPDIVRSKEFENIIYTIATDQEVAIEVVEKAFLDTYKKTGDVYHRSRLSLARIYDSILRKYYPQGIHIYDADSIQDLREKITQEFGDVSLPKNDRAIIGRICSIGMLCGRGFYKAKEESYIPDWLLDSIFNYISSESNQIFLINTIFDLFEDQLSNYGVDNKYFLQGILHEAFGSKLFFKRDYISKDSNITSIYSGIIQYIKKHDFPVSKQEIKDAFPGITDIVMTLATSDNDILNYFGTYLHASKIVLSAREQEDLKNKIAQLVSDEQHHHIKELFNIVNADNPIIFTRNSILFPFSAFSLVEHLFKEEFQFSRPYMAKVGVEIGLPGERLHDFLYSNDVFTVSDIRDFCKENSYSVNSPIDYVNSLNNDYLFVDSNTVISITRIGANQEIAEAVERIILGQITNTVPINEIDFTEFPTINENWSDWLVYSVLNKWGQALEVSMTSNQVRYAVPLVAPKGMMNESLYKDLKPADVGERVELDDLSNIDSLIADYIDI